MKTHSHPTTIRNSMTFRGLMTQIHSILKTTEMIQIQNRSVIRSLKKNYSRRILLGKVCLSLHSLVVA